ncbi:hypothetical protein WJX74_001644 [Apatococcus lobatus]|uniref:Uncharacterized protein n=1 Tax=Apatococcus lobatus TaxID=904363 RepID=A0AAW1S1K9_9CHLO
MIARDVDVHLPRQRDTTPKAEQAHIECPAVREALAQQADIDQLPRPCQHCNSQQTWVRVLIAQQQELTITPGHHTTCTPPATPRRQGISHQLCVIAQQGSEPFNCGYLLNIGFLVAGVGAHHVEFMMLLCFLLQLSATLSQVG